MLPSAACWVTIQLAAACAAATCGIWGWTDAAPAGSAEVVSVADTSNVASPTAEAPKRVRRMMCTFLASRTSTRKTPHPRGLTEPRPCVSTVGTLLTLRYPGSWCRLVGAPHTVADQRRSLTGFPSRAVQLQQVLLGVRYHGGRTGPLVEIPPGASGS